MTDTRVCLHGRTVLLGAGGVAGAGLLAACGSDDSDASGGGDDADTGDSGSDDTGGDAGGDDGGDTGGGDGDSLVAVADVEVGGGVIVAETVVVTQPTKGDFKGFDAICTHQGCPVAEVADGTINCNCHGSQFSIDDGSVVTGPATQPLAEVTISVDGDQILLG